MSVIDVLRVLLVSLAGLYAGSLFWFYVLHPRAPGMYWGALSAVLFILTAILDQIGRIGDPASWRVITYTAAVCCGFVGLYRAQLLHGRHR